MSRLWHPAAKIHCITALAAQSLRAIFEVDGWPPMQPFGRASEGSNLGWRTAILCRRIRTDMLLRLQQVCSERFMGEQCTLGE
jgi:hypothetical protein